MAWLNLAHMRPRWLIEPHRAAARRAGRAATPRGHYWVVVGTFILMLALCAAALNLDADRMLGRRPDTEMIVND